MNKLAGIFLILLGILVGGCAIHQSSGDLGHFLILKIAANGGKVPTPHSLPQLVGKWSYSDENLGTAITSDNVTLEQVDSFLRAIYGAPSEGGKTPAGDVQWVVPAKTAGVSIWYYRKGNGVQISILKPLKLQ